MNGEMNQWIWDTMLSMTLLMALVLIIRKPVAQFFGAKIAYMLWILPVARLFMPTLTREAPAEAVSATPTFIPDLAAVEMAAAAPAQSGAIAALASLDWAMIAIILWLGGAGLLFISKLASYLQFREDVIADGQMIGRHGSIKILETPAVGGPLAFGLLDKYIAVPTNFFRDYAPRERELALEHEIAHHESGDLAANFVGLTILSLHWFNPVAWGAWIAFRQDQETACDARILAQSGQDVRAVYGRTIAKSASGHRLGLASPLNQKDKIKGRLKMLGSSEKSSMRRRIGAGLVAAGTIVSLPLTATVTYAEAADPVDLSATDLGSVPAAPAPAILASPPSAPEAPAAPAAPRAGGDEIRITMLDGGVHDDSSKEHVRKIRHNGRTVILRTDHELSEEEARKLVEKAEKSRIAADKALRESEQFRKHKSSTMREIQRELAEARAEMRRDLKEAEQEVREAWSEARQARREAQAEAREAQREALIEARRAKQEAWQADAEERADPQPAALISAISYSTTNAVSGPDCAAMNKKIAMGGDRGRAAQAWAVVAGCGGFEVTVDKQAALKAALAGLEKQRAKAASCDENPAERARKLKEFDRSIEKVKAQMSMT